MNRKFFNGTTATWAGWILFFLLMVFEYHPRFSW